MSSRPTATDRELYGAVTAAEVAALDRAAGAAGVDVIQLMEVAGWQVARCAWHLLEASPQRVGVVAGHGNNGGDGLVAARHLAAWGCEVEIHVLGDAAAISPLLQRQVRAARAAAAETQVGSAIPAGALASMALVIDALLGTGLRSAPREAQAEAIRAMNEAGGRVLSIDVPSGLDASTGEAYDPCVRATHTCTLAAMKAGLWSQSAGAFTGPLTVADIGMPASAWEAIGVEPPLAVVGGELVPVPSST